MLPSKQVDKVSKRLPVAANGITSAKHVISSAEVRFSFFSAFQTDMGPC